MPRKISLTQEQEICNRYQKGENGMELARVYNITFGAIYKILARNDIKTRLPSVYHRRYTCNYRFFQHIDTERKAYWLGFLFADGYVHENRLVVVLQDRDTVHLRQFLDDISSTHPIKHYLQQGQYPTCNISIRSQQLIDDLECLGIIQAKSHHLSWPDIPSNVVHHFARGFIDGDGCFYIDHGPTKKNPQWNPQPRFSISGHKPFIQQLQVLLMTHCGVSKTRLRPCRNSSPDIVAMDYGGRTNIKSLIGYLYNDSHVYLKRKYTILKPYF